MGMPLPLPHLLLPLVVGAALVAQDQPGPGYTDTPILPSGWHVHDANRPRPIAVDPGPAPAQPLPVPADAIVLFDGKSLAAFTGRDDKAQWRIDEAGFAEVNRTGDIQTRGEFGDCQLHVEWATPSPAKGESQGRGNSGIFFLGRYEVQVLDSFENATYADGQAAALYGQTPPLVNACRRPGEWQTYDIVFRAPRFADDGKLLEPARITVIHNGILVQHDQAYLGPTQHRSLPRYEKHPTKGPIRLQDHGDPVRYRNLWIRPLDLDRPELIRKAAPSDK